MAELEKEMMEETTKDNNLDGVIDELNVMTPEDEVNNFCEENGIERNPTNKDEMYYYDDYDEDMEGEGHCCSVVGTVAIVAAITGALAIGVCVLRKILCRKK